ncbi:hypothetical protein QA646_08655 [Rhizobium sp. CB3090]|uniref:hypothetical protein n=1 Tax=Rhizobium sp. CB3090 TaxID=3039156 RepID=UPI0024B1C693|nr:hypothetical protein [Rhizobium sp. CB3090]WFU10892.1 hypothetical protein QA646_08655 [Rhizobium sp. CB3090]
MQQNRSLLTDIIALTKPGRAGAREDETALVSASRENVREAIQIVRSEIDDLTSILVSVQTLLGQRKEREEQLIRAQALLDETDDGQTRIPDNFASRRRERRSSLAWAVRREAYLALKRIGRPLSRREIHQELVLAGVEFKTEPGEPTLQAITKIMWKASEFVSTDDGYWLADETATPRRQDA